MKKNAKNLKRVSLASAAILTAFTLPTVVCPDQSTTVHADEVTSVPNSNAQEWGTKVATPTYDVYATIKYDTTKVTPANETGRFEDEGYIQNSDGINWGWEGDNTEIPEGYEVDPNYTPYYRDVEDVFGMTSIGIRFYRPITTTDTPAPSQGQDTPAPSQGQDTPAPSQGQDTPAPSQGQDTPAPSQGQDTPAPSQGQDTPAPSQGQDTPAPSQGQDTPAPSQGQDTPAPSQGQDTPAPSQDQTQPVLDKIVDTPAFKVEATNCYDSTKVSPDQVRGYLEDPGFIKQNDYEDYTAPEGYEEDPTVKGGYINHDDGIFIPASFAIRFYRPITTPTNPDTPSRGTDTPSRGTDTPSRGTDTPSRGTDTPSRGADIPNSQTEGTSQNVNTTPVVAEGQIKTIKKTVKPIEKPSSISYGNSSYVAPTSIKKDSLTPSTQSINNKQTDDNTGLPSTGESTFLSTLLTISGVAILLSLFGIKAYRKN